MELPAEDLALPLTRYALVRPVPKSYDHCVRTNVEKINVALAEAQHKAYCEVLEKLGLRLLWADRDDTLPDSCFVEDTAMIFGEKAVISNIAVASRKREIIRIAEMLNKFKRIYRIMPPATVDGGDILRIEDTILVGLSSRTNSAAHQQLQQILRNSGLKIVPVETHNILHLKSACTYLGDNCVVLSRGYFDTSVLRGLRHVVVPKGEEYAADCLAVNGTILVARGYPRTKKLIEENGFPTEELEMSEFRKGEGALTCLSIIW